MINEFAMLALMSFYERIDIFLVIFVRILTFVIVLPVLSGSSLPNMAKVMFSLAFAFMLFSTGQVEAIAYDGSVPGFVFVLIQEFFVGFTIGFVVYLIFNTIYFAGQLIDYQIGFSMVNVFDPQTQIQVPLTGNIFYFMMAALLVVSGGLHVLIAAMAYSFEVVPAGTEMLYENEALFMYIVGLLADFFIIGLRIAMPIAGSLILMDVALGILVKAVPQMNVFVVGLPMKLFVGLLILYLIVPNMVDMFNTIFDYSTRAADNAIGGLMP